MVLFLFLKRKLLIVKNPWYEVYLCYLDKEIVYIGSGALNRHRHCNSGVSHVYELNKLHFKGTVFDIKVQKYRNRKDALDKEKHLIQKHLPKFNTVFTPKHSNKHEYMNKCREFREVFTSYYEDSGNFNRYKIFELLDQFLKCHPLTTVEVEGVLLRGRNYYIVKGCEKLATLITNHRKINSNVFIMFLRLLDKSLEKFYNRKIVFRWFMKTDNSLIEFI